MLFRKHSACSSSAPRIRPGITPTCWSLKQHLRQNQRPAHLVCTLARPLHPASCTLEGSCSPVHQCPPPEAWSPHWLFGEMLWVGRASHSRWAVPPKDCRTRAPALVLSCFLAGISCSVLLCASALHNELPAHRSTMMGPLGHGLGPPDLQAKASLLSEVLFISGMWVQ